MEFRRIESPSLTDLFTRQLEELIISGKMKPGERLPTERELAAQMGISVAVVNGGIMRLAKLGFLKVAPRKGVFVEDYIRNGNSETLEVLLQYSGEYYRADMQRALLDYRRVIETRAIESACKCSDGQFLANAEGLLARLEREEDDGEFASLAYEIHHELVLCGGNIIDSLVFTSFRPIYVSFYHAGVTMRGKGEITAFFRELLGAVGAGDLNAAISVLDDSLDRWNTIFTEKYSDGQRYERQS